jgi:hypothetical protein
LILISADYLSWLSFLYKRLTDNEKNTTYPYCQD